MSQTSIQDDGFTPPDFIQKVPLSLKQLLKRQSTVSSENSFMPLSAISNLQHCYFSSAPLLPLDQKYSPSKLQRTHSLNEQERISTKKFKIFFSTIMQGIYSQTERLQIWQNFQQSLGNPFEYDKFIDKIRAQKQNQKKQKEISIVNLKDLQVTQNLERSNSVDKKQNKTSCHEYLSQRKITICPNIEKQKMKKNICYIRTIGKHGSNYLKQK